MNLMEPGRDRDDVAGTTGNEFGLCNKGGLGAGYTHMSIGEATEVLRSGFGIEGLLTRLATEKDDTFRVESPRATKYVLKVANPTEDPDEVSFQIELLRHVSRTDASIPVPSVLMSCAGASSLAITDRAGQRRCVRLMSYLDGTPLDRTEANAKERFQVGQVLGRLRYATAEFSHPADSRVLAWDVKHLLNLRNLLRFVDDGDRRRKLRAALERFASLTDRIGKLRMQVLHNDFSKSNIIVDHASAGFVTGIIDFGDSVRTAIAIDVATALLNQLPRNGAQATDDLFADGRDVLRGYLSIAELTEEELRLVPHLAMGRVVARALITLWRSKLFPENSTYILRNTDQGWAQLEWFLARSMDAVSSELV